MSTDLTFEEFARMHNLQPGKPGPIKKPEDILVLIDVVMVLLYRGNPEEVFGFEAIMAELRGLLDPGQTIDDLDVQGALAFSPSAIKVDGGYRYRIEVQLKQCDTCSAWSELVARSIGGAPVEALCLNPKSPCHGQYKTGIAGCHHWSDDPALADHPSERAPGARP